MKSFKGKKSGVAAGIGVHRDGFWYEKLQKVPVYV